MGNPYPAQFTDESGEVRLEGFVGFTDPTNQPGTGATLLVSSAELLAIVEHPLVIVPAAPGKIIVCTAASVEYVAGSTPYTDNGGNLTIELAPDSASPGGSPSLVMTVTGAGFWDQAASQVSWQGFGSNSGVVPTATYLGQALMLSGGGADPTLGNGTLKVTVAYTLV